MKLLFVLLTFLLVAFSANGQAPVVEVPASGKVSLLPGLQYVQGTSALPLPNLSLVSGEDHRFELAVRNSSNGPVAVMVQLADRFGADFAEIIVNHQNKADTFQAGYLIPSSRLMSESNGSYFPLDLSAYEKVNITIAVSNITGFPVKLQLSTFPLVQYQRSRSLRVFGNGFIIGLLFLAGILSMFIGNHKERAFRMYFGAFMAVMGLFLLYNTGYLKTGLLGDNYIAFLIVRIVILSTFGPLYLMSLYRLLLPVIEKNGLGNFVPYYIMGKLLVLLGLIIAHFLNVGYHRNALLVSLFFVPFEATLAAVLLAYAYFKNYRVTGLVLLMLIGAAIFSVVVTVISVVFLISGKLLFLNLIPLVISAEMLLFIIAIVSRQFKLHKAERAKMRKLMHETRQSISSKREVTEEYTDLVKVLQKRVDELEQMYDTQKEIAEVQTHKLEQQEKQLNLQHQIVEQQNHQLLLNNNNLDALVDTRTNQLKDINLALVKQTNQLEQFAHITAHNLRAPVASLLGLVSIINHEQFLDEHNRKILTELEKSTNAMNLVLHDLKNILNVKNVAAQQIETIFLNDSVNQVSNMLDFEVRKTNADIITDFSEINYIRTVKDYLIGLLYQLISNAIKHRHPERRPQVLVKSDQQGEVLLLEITDNGVGIDMERYGEKLFGMYQRFNLDTEGKGLGLYMAKAQLEALNGTVEVQSEVGVGTVFTLKLKNWAS